MFVHCLLNEFAICFSVSDFVLNVTVFFVVGKTTSCLPQCVCCFCNPNVSAGVPSIYFLCDFGHYGLLGLSCCECKKNENLTAHQRIF